MAVEPLPNVFENKQSVHSIHKRLKNILDATVLSSAEDMLTSRGAGMVWPCRLG